MTVHTVTLTRLESQVLSLIRARLLTVRQTAARLGITEGTVNTCVRRLSRKFGGAGIAGWTALEATADSLFESYRGNTPMTQEEEQEWRLCFWGAVIWAAGSSADPAAETHAVLARLVEEGALVKDDPGRTYRLGTPPPIGEG